MLDKNATHLFYFKEPFPGHRGVHVLLGKRTAHHSVRQAGLHINITNVWPEQTQLPWHRYYSNMQQDREIFWWARTVSSLFVLIETTTFLFPKSLRHILALPGKRYNTVSCKAAALKCGHTFRLLGSFSNSQCLEGIPAQGHQNSRVGTGD